MLSRIKRKLFPAPAPQPAAAEPVDVDVTDEAAPGSNWSPTLDVSTSGWFNHATRELMPGFVIDEGDAVLDVGCGDAPFTGFCASMGAELFFCDIKESNVRETKNNLKRVAGGTREGFVTDGKPLPIVDASMDKIIMMEVLEHVDCPRDYVAELKRIARPGARLLITVPDTAHEMIQRELAPDSYFQKPNHIRIFDREEFQNLILEAGLEIERKDFYGFYWSLWWFMFWACKHDIVDPWHPVLLKWTDTWNTLLSTDDGPKIKRVLDNHLPKSQVIIARKPLN